MKTDMLQYIDFKLSAFYTFMLTLFFIDISIEIRVITGLIFLGYNIHRWYTFNKNKGIERQIKELELKKLKEETRKLEVENNKADLENYLFREEINNMTKEELEKSRNRLKNKKNGNEN